MKPEWLDRVLAAVKPELPRDFVGRIEVNVFQGSIATVNIEQSFKGDMRQKSLR